MGRGGGSGGGRSFGGRSSGSRSFGHVSGGSSRGGFSPGRAGGSGGGSSPGRSLGSPFIFFGGFGGGRSYGGRYGSGYYRGPSPFRVGVAVIVLILIVFAALLFANYSANGSVPASTYAREPLAKGVALETAYLKDDAHWIDNVSGVERAMKYFYDKTGVFPYLWIAETLDGESLVSDEAANAALEALYDAEIGDEGHIAILFLEPYPKYYDIYYVAGAAARTVLDQEACDILMNYFVRYYTSDYEDSEYFAQVFIDAADRIMTKTVPTSRILLFAAIGLIALVCVFLFILAMVRRVNERKRLNAEILNTPIDGDDAIHTEDEADRKAKDYE
jgi:hypothetical protein